jgi:hypothetical protein
MLDGLSSREWSEWQVFWHLHGWGEKRMDVRFAQLMSLIANLVRSGDDGPIPPDQFLPEEYDPDDDEIEAVLTEATALDEDQAIFEAMYREMTKES